LWDDSSIVRLANSHGCKILALAIWPLCVGVCHVDAKLNSYRVSQRHMGAEATLVFYAPNPSVANEVAETAFQRIAELDSCLSDYDSRSELVRFGRSSQATETLGIRIKLSEDMWNVLVKSQQFSRLSDGAFDITVGPLSQLWRATRKSAELPAESVLAARRAAVGWQLLRLDPANRTGQLQLLNMSLDVGGIAKGYAADEALLVLRESGVTRAMVNFGGDMALGDPPPDRDGWPVTLSPAGDNRSVECKLRLANCGVATSGDAWQFIEIEGRRYSHVLDPMTGLGLTARRGVSIVAATGTEADALASAVCVLGREKGFKLLAKFAGASGICAENTESGIRWDCSEEFRELIGKGGCQEPQGSEVPRQ